MEPTSPIDEPAPATGGTPERSGLGLVARVVSPLVLAVAGAIVLGLLAITVGPRFLPYQALVVRSGSMSPTVPTGSVVFYHRVAADDVKVGQVIVFSRPGQRSQGVTHPGFKIAT